MMSIWVGILTFSATPIILLNLLLGREFPKSETFYLGARWAIVGALTAFGVWLIMVVSSCCFRDDLFMLGCFLPLLGLLGFTMGGLFQEFFPYFALILIVPFLAGLLHPFVGESLAVWVGNVIIFGAVGIIIYFRITRGLPNPKPKTPSTIVWNYARCPRCDNLWTLGRAVTEIPERCPTCGWSWVDHNLDPHKIPSFVNPSPKTKKR